MHNDKLLDIYVCIQIKPKNTKDRAKLTKLNIKICILILTISMFPIKQGSVYKQYKNIINDIKMYGNIIVAHLRFR